MKCPTPEDRTHAFAQEHSWSIRALLPRLDWHALWQDEEEEDWLLYPLIPARRLIALFSSAGAGKSLLMLEMAAALSTGRKVLGHDPGRRIRVLYIDFENDPRGDVRTRLQDMGYEPDELDCLDYLSFPSLPYLDSEAGAASLIAAVEAYQPELVVIDTISRAVAGEENDNDTWLNFYKHTGLAMKQAGVALIRLDHTGKDGTKGERGGSAKRGDIDASWLLTETVRGQRYRLECVKHRFMLDTLELALARHEFPLHHTVEDVGAGGGELEMKIRELVEKADRDDLPTDTGFRKFKTWMIERDLKGGTKAIKDAIHRRKSRDGLAFDPVDNSAKPVDKRVLGVSEPRTHSARVPDVSSGGSGNGQNPLSSVSSSEKDTEGHGSQSDVSPPVPPYKGDTGTQRTPDSDGWPCPECNGKGFHRAACSRNPTRRVVEDE